MESLHRAQQEFRRLKQQEVELEEEMMKLLEERGGPANSKYTSMHKKRLAEIDDEIAQVQNKQAEHLMLINYYESRSSNVMMIGDDFVTLAYVAARADVGRQTVQGANHTLVKLANAWSLYNSEKRITSLLVATPSTFLGVLEGPEKKVEETFAKIRLDERAMNLSILCRQRCESREFTLGLKLHVVEDDLVCTFLEEMKLRGEGAKLFCPAGALSCALRGGDPRGLAPATADCICLCAVLDYTGGAEYGPESSMAVARAFDEAVASHNGVVCERFGEFATAVFALSGPTPTSAALRAATRIRSAVSFTSIAVHFGAASVASSPCCTAFGKGLRDVQKLAFLSEHLRRPLIISPPAADRCNHAEHPLDTFTVDNVLYFTLRSIGEDRLPPPMEIVKNFVYEPGEEPIDEENPTKFRKPTATEICEKNRLDAHAQWKTAQSEIYDAFRLLDVGNCGWISKRAFRDFASKVAKTKLFPGELPKIFEQLGRLNRLGKERLNFEEFAFLYTKLAHCEGSLPSPAPPSAVA